jgi:dolichyl-diphosphooligosaccharide--protein glycosyltransferase
VRQQQLPRQGPTLDYLEEAFTSENWIVRPFLPDKATRVLTFPFQVRIYEVKKEDPLGRDHKIANAFAGGKKRKRTRPTSRRRALVEDK